jgi:hypothetical protein
MRRTGLAAALLVLGLAACGGDDEVAAPPSAAPEPATSRVPVTVQAAFADEDPQVVLVQVASSGACALEEVRYALEESAEQVSVRVTAAEPAQPCSGEPDLGNVEVALAEPLGGRELVDGSTDDVVQVATGDAPGPAVPTIEAELE